MIDSTEVLRHLWRTTESIYGEEELIRRLDQGSQLRIKFGVDCTAPELHLGHAVNLWMMRYLQDLGHKVVFLIGDTTTRIGDPTGRSVTRPVLTAQEIEKNAKEFLDQVSLVLRTDPEVLEIRRNSEWWDNMLITDLLKELSSVTHAHLTSRDMFQRRIEQGLEIAMHELIYPVLQGYDSVALKSDLTIVGSDQLFNESMGRTLQSKHGQIPQTVITSVITPGLDGGAKQSKSLNNYVGLAHSAKDQFGRLMTLNDDLLGVWAKVYTDLPLSSVDAFGRAGEAGGTEARDAKMDLAMEIVARYHGRDSAMHERDEFINVFSRRELPSEMPVLSVSSETISVLDLCVLARPNLSKSALRRLISDGAVHLGDVSVTDPFLVVQPAADAVLRIGRRHWFRIAVE